VADPVPHGDAWPVVSVGAGKIVVVTAAQVLALVVGLVIGLAVGAVAAWQVARSRGQADRAGEAARRAEAEAALARHAGELAQTRTQSAEARAEMHQAREELSRTLAAMADVRAEAATAEAQRDLARARAKEIADDRDQLVAQFKLVSAETIDKQSRSAEAAAEARLKATEQLMAPVRESLDRFNARLTEVEKERVRLATELRTQVSAVQQTGEGLRRETRALATALRKPHVRGNWGELQLKRVVELAGMVEHCDFTTQHTTQVSTGAKDRIVRPDLRVDLSDGKCVFVDSKVPLEAFLDAYETDDERDRTAALNRFADNVRTHIDQLSAKKYWQAEAHTPEFVVLFMPSEALAAEAASLLPDLHEYAAKRDIVLATPTTLIALLRAVAHGWKQAKLAENAAAVSQLGRELHDRLVTMGAHYDKLGRAIGSVVKAYNATLGTLETRVMVSARRFRDLDVTGEELAEISGIDEPLRSLGDAELVENAAAVRPMIGRKPATHSELPEAKELVRGEPDLFGDPFAAAPRDERGQLSS